MPPGRFDHCPTGDHPIDEGGRATFWERSTRQEKPDRDDGFADGAGTFLLYRPETWKSVRKIRVTGAWSHGDVPERFVPLPRRHGYRPQGR